jgi:dethiobiotin synthetase
MKRYFITGTDTDCGKTYVTKKLTEFFSSSVAIKPVASGCSREGDTLVSSDALQLQKNKKLPLEQINPWAFYPPISPHIAARQANSSIKIEELISYCINFHFEHTDMVFIEGAGGLMVPLNEQHTWIDFLNKTQIPVILVVGMTLGCINHALLTAIALKVNQIPCVGWIANCLDPKMLALEENIDTLRDKLPFPLLAQLSFDGKFSEEGEHRLMEILCLTKYSEQSPKFCYDKPT